MVKLSNVEKLIIKQAFVNAVSNDVSTKNPDNLRGQLDATMKQAYYDNPLGGRSFDLRLMGRKVGTYSVTVSEGKPQEVSKSLEVKDRAQFMEWAEANGYVEKVADMDAILSDFRENGEIPDGCEPIEVVTPEVVGGVVTRSTMRVYPKKVAEALGPQLEAAAYALLEGVGDD